MSPARLHLSEAGLDPLERINEALDFVDPGDRDNWLRVAMAIKAEVGEVGFEVWNIWSQGADSYNPTDARDVWRSCKENGGVGVGTLYHLARQGGWRPNGAHPAPGPEEVAARRRKVEARAAAGRAEIERERAEAAGKAAAIWKAASPADGNPYLVRKGVAAIATLRQIEAERAREVLSYAPQSGGEPLTGTLLVVPLCQRAEVTTLELINEAGAKTALRGRGTRAGGYWAAQPLPEGVGAGLTLQIGEGVATVLSAREAIGHPALAALSSGNLLAVANAMRSRYPSARLIVLADLVKATGEPDPHAIEAAREVGGLVAAPDFGPGRDPGQTDFNDLHQTVGLEAVRRAIEAASAPTGTAPSPNAAAAPGADEPPPASLAPPASERARRGTTDAGMDTEESERTEDSLDATVARLAKLKPLEYEQVREDEAKRLRVRVGVLDKEVARARPSDGSVKGDELSFEEVLAWSDPVDGVAILDEIRGAFGRYVVAPAESLDALTLWALCTWCYDAFPIFPKAFVSSPVKRCGKSVTLEVLETVVCRPVMASSVSASSIFRTVHEWRPTLIVDEADRLPKDSEELIGIINAGHKKRAAYVIRTEKVGDKFTPVRYSVWSPMALGAIGRMADTIMDRSVVVHLRRKVQGERAEKVPLLLFEQHRELRQQCLRWAEDHMATLPQSSPILPSHGNDRAIDNWSPLFAIADAAGGHWPNKATAAFKKLTVEEEDESIGPALLRDVRNVFAGLREGTTNIFSKDLVAALVAMEERPWAEWRKGKAMTQHSLARLLHPYKISSGTVRVGTGTSKGYCIEQFRDAWDRYLGPMADDPPVESVTPSHRSNGAGFSADESVTPDKLVTARISPEPSNGAACDDVTVQKGGDDREGYTYVF